MNSLAILLLVTQLFVTNAHASDDAVTKISIISVVNKDDTTLAYRGIRYGYDYELRIWRAGGVRLSAYLKSWFCDRQTNVCYEANGYPLIDINKRVVYTAWVNGLTVKFRIDGWSSSEQVVKFNFSSE